jgi:hypothetical protein
VFVTTRTQEIDVKPRTRKLLAAPGPLTLAAALAASGRQAPPRVTPMPAPVIESSAAPAPEPEVATPEPAAAPAPEPVYATPMCDAAGRPLAGNVRTKGAHACASPTP